MLTGLVVTAVLLAGCAGPRRPPAAASPPPTRATPRGFVGSFLPASSDSDVSEREANIKFVSPVPRTELTIPDYPSAALDAGVSPFTVALRIRIDPQDGRVTHVEPSPSFESSTGPFERDFRLAAERAVRLWRFTPGRLDRIERDYGDGVSRVVESIEIAVLDDVQFDFEIVGEEP